MSSLFSGRGVCLELVHKPFLYTLNGNLHGLTFESKFLLLVRELLGSVHDLYAEHIGKMFDSFGIRLAFKIHHKAYGITVSLAPETVIGVSGRIDMKRRCPLVMERTTTYE